MPSGNQPACGPVTVALPHRSDDAAWPGATNALPCRVHSATIGAGQVSSGGSQSRTSTFDVHCAVSRPSDTSTVTTCGPTEYGAAGDWLNDSGSRSGPAEPAARLVRFAEHSPGSLHAVGLVHTASGAAFSIRHVG